MADVSDELSGVFEFEDCSGMSGLDVLLLEMVAETHDYYWQARAGYEGAAERYATLLCKPASLSCALFGEPMSSGVPESVEVPLSPGAVSQAVTSASGGQLAQRISELGEWFHNVDLHGVPTAPHHFLGDFPNIKWKQIASEHKIVAE